MLLNDIARTSAGVAGARARSKKIERLGSLLGGARPEEVPVAVAYLSGALPHGAIGVGWASLRELPPPAAEATLEVLAVDAALRRIGSTTGAGSQAARKRELADLFGRATEIEQRFLR
ncbi:MAG TPA: ATP-dependent DNA ligase, partial [Actinomycetota bacterium]